MVAASSSNTTTGDTMMLSFNPSTSSAIPSARSRRRSSGLLNRSRIFRLLMTVLFWARAHSGAVETLSPNLTSGDRKDKDFPSDDRYDALRMQFCCCYLCPLNFLSRLKICICCMCMLALFMMFLLDPMDHAL